MTENKERVNSKETPFVGQKAIEEMGHEGYNKNVMRIVEPPKRPDPAE